jgi:hypothetical protein
VRICKTGRVMDYHLFIQSLLVIINGEARVDDVLNGEWSYNKENNDENNYQIYSIGF